MVELPKTEAELQALIDASVKEATKDTISKSEHDGAMASQRTKYESKIKDLETKAGIDAQQKAEELAQEKQKEMENELTELRAFKKSSVLKEKLAKEGLPSFLANDNRLLTAEDGDLDKVIKVVKGEYEANLPKGNTHSSVIQTTSQPAKSSQDGEKEEAYRKASEVLQKAFGN